MDTTERILNQLRKLPDAAKVEVLDFVDFLVIKARSLDEGRSWSNLSVEAALRGMFLVRGLMEVPCRAR